VLLAGLLTLALFAQVGDTEPGEPITVDFQVAAVGKLPAGFSTAVTGGGGPPAWRVVEDSTAAGSGRVLAQQSADRTPYRFPLCIYDPFSAKDVEVSVRFKSVSGTVDQAAGLVTRFKDPDNYYVVRANALEDNVRLYKVERGKRTQLASSNVKVLPQQWQSLTLVVKRTHFWVSLNDRLLFETEDATFRSAGKAGLWTKADSVTYFDDFKVQASEAR